MLFFLFSPVYLFLNGWFIYEACKWLTAVESFLGWDRKPTPKKIIKAVKLLFGILWGFFTVCIFIAFFLPAESGMLRRVLKLAANYHLAVFIYMLLGLAVVLLGRLLERIYVKLRKKSLWDKTDRRFVIRRSAVGLLYILLVISVTLFGVYEAGNIKTKHYDISVDKDGGNLSELKLVLVSDLHLGYNIGCRQMEKMVEKINAEQPDLVVIAGDIFDNEYEALEDPDRLIEILSSIESRYGVYAVYGNHDVDEKIIGGFTFDWKSPKESSEEMDEFVSRCGIRLLCDEYVLIDDSFYLYGRPDYERPGKNVTERKSPEELTAELDLSKPVIVIDHEPRELSELSEAGVDLDLSGHTHDGQFFPLNLTSRYLTWENSAGLLKKGNMTSIVSSGVGLYGPNIRVGTDAEVCGITVHFR